MSQSCDNCGHVVVPDDIRARCHVCNPEMKEHPYQLVCTECGVLLTEVTCPDCGFDVEPWGASHI